MIQAKKYASRKWSSILITGNKPAYDLIKPAVCCGCDHLKKEARHRSGLLKRIDVKKIIVKNYTSTPAVPGTWRQTDLPYTAIQAS